ERPTRTENVVVVIRVQYSTTPDVRPKEGHRGDAASVLLYAIGGWWALEQGSCADVRLQPSPCGVATREGRRPADHARLRYRHGWVLCRGRASGDGMRAAGGRIGVCEIGRICNGRSVGLGPEEVR